MEKIFNFKITPIVLAIFVILLSVGYSAFQESMNITGSVLDVRVEADIRITGVTVSSYTQGVMSSYEEYNVHNFSSGLLFQNAGSITYKIEITNFGNVPMALSSINGLPYGLTYDIIDYKLKDKLCDTNGNCTLGSKTEISLRISTAPFVTGYNQYALKLDFEFKPFYSVTYKNVNNVNYPTSVLEGEDLNVTFDTETTIKEIKMGNNVLSSNKYTFDGINLTVPNVSGDIVITLPPTLISTLLEQYSPTNTTGLVKDSTNSNLYYYTGNNEQVSNNFLWYGGHQWRVLEFDTSENSVTLITQQPLTAIYPASAVWTTQEAYESSYINQWLNDYFWNSLDSSIQNNILDTTFNIGRSTNVSEITTNQKVGLLDVNQYNRARATDSFLDIKDAYWLGTIISTNIIRPRTYIQSISNSGIISGSSHYATYKGVRPVIKISNITITEGDGTLASNYQIGNKATSTNNVQVGEYINVPYKGSDNACGSDNTCTFRVVSKDNDSIKVVLNGLLPITSAWADSASNNITTSDLIYTNVLNSFIANIDSKYITAGTYGVGMYASSDNYTLPQSSTITANIGLPTVGEMFSGNDIDMGSTKTFVDVNTIENPTVSDYYWTMNRNNSSNVKVVNNDGEMENKNPSSVYGVRPVIFLKNDLTFIEGDGTVQSPYELPKSLIDTLLEQSDPIYNMGYLVKDENNPDFYYFSGSSEYITQNYLWYGGFQWRVLDLNTSDRTVTLISEDPLTSIAATNNVWTTKEAYESSFINSWLNDYFYNSLDSSIQSNILDTTFNVGIYTNVDEITTTQKVGLLDADQFNRSGGWLSYDWSIQSNDYPYWLGNRYDSERIDSSFGQYLLCDMISVRPVIKISDIVITGGDGTVNSSYRTDQKSTSTSNIQVGEYINVPYNGNDNACGDDNICTFRVVSKDNNSIKVILNGLLPETIQFGSSATISTDSLVYSYINEFASGISNLYRYTGTKNFYIGDLPRTDSETSEVYNIGIDYRSIKDEIFQSNIGLPIYGELFSTNDIQIKDISYWLMNRINTGINAIVNSDGYIADNYDYRDYHYVRPVIYLKSNLELTGEGTAQSPYEIVPPTPPKSVSFAEDSWETIHKIVEMGLASEYYNVGDEKEVILAGYTNGSESTFTVRIANIETPAECATEGFSQTACGFVVEFVDIITEHGMNLENTSMGGWPSSEMRRFVNSDIYNALPKELRDIIIETNVVSGYDAEDYATLNSTDKIYLLALEEITLFDDTTLKNKKTKMLKFYQNFYDRCYVADPYGECNVSPALKNYHGNGSMWWLRTAYVNSDSTFQMIFEEGEYSLFIIPATSKSGVAPAFRIG